MKKIFYFTIAFVLTGVSVSCSKKYTCSCTSTYADGSQLISDETITFKAKTLQEANGQCSNLNESYTGIGTSYSRTCTGKVK